MPFRFIKYILGLYKQAKISDKLIILARLLFSVKPIIDVIERYIPKNGLIVDLGCGYGIISHLLSLSYPDREFIGFDISKSRIDVAQKTNSDNAKFWLSDIRDAQFPICNAIIIIDILYLLPYQDQESVLIKCFERLEQKGTLIIKDTNKSSDWKFYWTYIEEKIKTKFRLYGKEINKSSLYYRSIDDFINLLQNIGFDVSAISKKTFLPYPGIFYICQKL